MARITVKRTIGWKYTRFEQLRINVYNFKETVKTMIKRSLIAIALALPVAVMTPASAADTAQPEASFIDNAMETADNFLRNTGTYIGSLKDPTEQLKHLREQVSKLKQKNSDLEQELSQKWVTELYNYKEATEAYNKLGVFLEKGKRPLLEKMRLQQEGDVEMVEDAEIPTVSTDDIPVAPATPVKTEEPVTPEVKGD